MSYESLLSENNFLAAVESETSYGESGFGGSEPTEFIAFSEFDWSKEVETVEFDGRTATHSGRTHEAYDGSASVSWEVPLVGIDDPDGTPSMPLAPLLKANNLSETVDTTLPKFSYNWVTGSNMSDVPSVTFAHYMMELGRDNARKLIFEGMRGNTTLNLEMGQIAKLSGDYTGLYTEIPEATTALPSNPSGYVGEGDRFLVVGMTVEIGGTSYAVESIEISSGWSVDEEHEATQAGSTLAYVYLSRTPDSRPSGSTTLKGRSSVVETLLPAIRDGETFTFEASLENKNGDILTVSAPSLQFGNYSMSADGNVNFDCPFFLNGEGEGENEFLLEFERSA